MVTRRRNPTDVMSRIRRNIAFLKRVIDGGVKTLKEASVDEVLVIREVCGNLLRSYFDLTADQKQIFRRREKEITKCFKSSRQCRLRSRILIDVMKTLRPQLEKLLRDISI